MDTASHKSKPQKIQASTLYVTAVPIGNLADITLRALDTLKQVDLILCEDTRVSKKLLDVYEIKTPLRCYNDHTTPNQRSRFVSELEKGASVVLISDAGTPLISDPGYKLVEACHAAGIAVVGLPGACAATTALSIAGLPSDRFMFVGFLPNKTKARQNALASLKTSQTTLIVYESPKRLVACLQDLQAQFGDADAAVIRELTKRYEETKRGSLSTLVDDFAKRDNIKGEITIIVAPGTPGTIEDDELKTMITKLLNNGHSVKDCAAMLSHDLGVTKKHIYDLALAAKKEL